MRHLVTATATLILVVCLGATPALAHEVTYRGTVVSTDAKAIRMTVVDAKTKKSSTLTFEHDKNTKFLRGDKLMSVVDVKIQKGEKIALTVNTDDDENYAQIVRLDEKK